MTFPGETMMNQRIRRKLLKLIFVPALFAINCSVLAQDPSASASSSPESAATKPAAAASPLLNQIFGTGKN